MDVIRTNEANCRDCYKCLRSCPVKAIRVERTSPSHQLHACVDGSRCILDGRCIASCPQGAKDVRIDYPAVRDMIAAGEDVWVSLAPSFVAAFPEYRPGQTVAALKRLGFSGVQETAVAAEWVAAEHARVIRENADGPVITSSCPAIVNLLEMYYPGVLPHLAPVASPMIVHARWLKAREPRRRVVFIGPCLAKHEEIHAFGQAGAVDHVLAFNELERWWTQEDIDPSHLDDEAFDGPRPAEAVLFPLDGGLLRTAGLSTDMLDAGFMTVSGLENCQAFIEGLGLMGSGPRAVEMMACPGGCVNGPVMPKPVSGDMYSRRQRVLDYRNAHPGYAGGTCEKAPEPDMLRRVFVARPVKPVQPTDAELRAILAKSGKLSPSDELNCGACGYGSCKEKAVAVHQGMADPEMCIPYMRVKAESMSNLVVASTPNGILVVDGDEVVLDMNAAAERMFQAKRSSVIGRKADRLMEPDCFRRVLSGKDSIVRQELDFPELSLAVRIAVVKAERENVALALIEDITEQRGREQELQRVRTETLGRAQEVIDKQMAVAQKIAGLLGETTAETKVLLTRLMRVMKEEGNNDEPVSRGRKGSTE